MARSGPADDRDRCVPRWIVFAPLVASFFSLAVQLVGADDCDGSGASCRSAWDAFTWLAVVFPHALAFPLITATGIGSAGAAVIMAVFDAAIIILILRTQPPRLSFTRLGGLWAIWAVLTAASVFAAPELMVAGWKAFH